MTRAWDLFQRLRVEGEVAIDEFIAQRASEELFLDFKCSASSANERRLSDSDRNNLAKAISGFGNSEGGVVLWGVDCRPHLERGDVAHMKFAFENPERFKSWLEGAVSGCTVPPHAGVQHLAIPSTADRAVGFVATLIPAATNLPVQVSKERIYYMRAGSSFERIPHGVLAGMFGRPMAPTLRHYWEINHVTRGENFGNTMAIFATLRLQNDGPGLARDLFASINVVNKLRNSCDCRVTNVQLAEWQRSSSHGRLYSVIGSESVRLPPGGVIDALNVELEFPAAPEQALRLECTIGCSNGMPHHFIVHAEPQQVAAIRDEFFAAMPTKPQYIHKAAKIFGRRLFAEQ